MYTHLIKKKLFFMNALSPILVLKKEIWEDIKLVDYILHYYATSSI
jgi:hypothetical protein